MPPSLVRKEINISSEAFDEITGALQDAGIKLEKDDSFTITKDISIKGPILYRQVNLKHQILMEVVKVYKTPIDKDFEVSNSSHFIDFLDDVYLYCLTGEKPAKPENRNQTKATSTKPKNKPWGQS